LADWLMSITNELALCRSVVSLCITLLDGYTAAAVIEKAYYQLIGLAALLLAYK